jgi:hypothetical protein
MGRQPLEVVCHQLPQFLLLLPHRDAVLLHRIVVLAGLCGARLRPPTLQPTSRPLQRLWVDAWISIRKHSDCCSVIRRPWWRPRYNEDIFLGRGWWVEIGCL